MFQKRNLYRIIALLIITSTILRVSFGQTQMQSGNLETLSPATDFSTVIASTIQDSSGQAIPVEQGMVDPLSVQSENLTPMAGAMPVSTGNIDDLGDTVATQASGIQPASSVVGYFPRNGLSNYFPAVLSGVGTLPAIFVQPETAPPTSFPGALPPPLTPVPSVPPPTTFSNNGLFPPAPGSQAGFPVTAGSQTFSIATSPATQQNFPTSLWPYVFLPQPELFLQPVFPGYFPQKGYYNYHLPKWLKFLPDLYKYNYGLTSPPAREYGEFNQPYAYEYYEPAEFDLYYWAKKKKKLGKRKRKNNLYKRFV